MKTSFLSHGRADSTFGPVSLKVVFFGSDAGWMESRYPQLLGDTHGDGREELIGFGHLNTYVNLA